MTALCDILSAREPLGEPGNYEETGDVLARISEGVVLVLIASCATAAEPAKPIEVELPTADAKLRATYYAGIKGKDSIPVVTLHEFRGNRGQLAAVASDLQQHGFAVLNVELRGHGSDSKDRTPFRLREHAEEDLAAVTRFLADEHDQKRLNIRRLTVVGVGFGGLLPLGCDLSKLPYPIAGVTAVSPPLALAQTKLRIPTKTPAEYPRVLLIAGDQGPIEVRSVEDLSKHFCNVQTDLLPTRLQKSKLVEKFWSQKDGRLKHAINTFCREAAPSSEWKSLLPK